MVAYLTAIEVCPHVLSQSICVEDVFLGGILINVNDRHASIPDGNRVLKESKFR